MHVCVCVCVARTPDKGAGGCARVSAALGLSRLEAGRRTLAGTCHCPQYLQCAVLCLVCWRVWEPHAGWLSTVSMELALSEALGYGVCECVVEDH